MKKKNEKFEVKATKDGGFLVTFTGGDTYKVAADRAEKFAMVIHDLLTRTPVDVEHVDIKSGIVGRGYGSTLYTVRREDVLAAWYVMKRALRLV